MAAISSTHFCWRNFTTSACVLSQASNGRMSPGISISAIANRFQGLPGRNWNARTWSDSEMFQRRALCGVRETRALSDLLSPSYFIQAQIFPYNYQDVIVRGNATRINALFLREYFRQRHSIPELPMPRAFEGGYTDIFFTGVARNVWHCDVASLYPSIMLQFDCFPATRRAANLSASAHGSPQLPARSQSETCAAERDPAKQSIIFRRCKTRSRFCSTASTVTLDSRRDISPTSTPPRVSRKSGAIC